MKTKLTETKCKPGIGVTSQFVRAAACLSVAILICASASAQNVFVSGSGCCVCDGLDNSTCGEIFEFAWNGRQTIFAFGLTKPGDVAFDQAGNLFVVDFEILSLIGNAAIYKITPNGKQTIFASGLSYPLYFAADKTGNLFVADYNQGVIYKYKSDGTRTTLTTGLYHPVGMACDTVGNLWVADNNAGNLHQGAIYQFNTNGSRATFALLAPTDRPADLALDNMNGLYVADLNGDVYRYDLGVLYRNPRTKFGSVPNSAKSLAWDTSGNLYVLDAGDINGNGNMIYKFTTEAVRTVFASAQSLGETFEFLAIQPPVCCQ